MTPTRIKNNSRVGARRKAGRKEGSSTEAQVSGRAGDREREEGRGREREGKNKKEREKEREGQLERERGKE